MAKMALKKTVKKLLRMHDSIEAPRGIHAEFHLTHEGLQLGVLSVEGDYWTFHYTDEFRKQSNIKPIIEFPDVEKTYKSRQLWPFFQIRIPSLKQPEVERILKAKGIDEKDVIRLLKLFGEETIANPFKLKAA